MECYTTVGIIKEDTTVYNKWSNKWQYIKMFKMYLMYICMAVTVSDKFFNKSGTSIYYFTL